MKQDHTFAHEIALSKITFLGILPGESKRHCVYRLWRLGLTYKQIQLIAGVSPNTVSNVITNYLKAGHYVEEAAAKRGRPTKLNADNVRKIIQMTEENPRISGKSLSELLSLSIATVNKVRNENDFEYVPPKVMADLTPEQIQKRITFGYSLYESEIDFRSILFLDEFKMSLHPDNRNVWRKKGSQNPNIYLAQKKFDQSVMVFGLIGINFKSKLVFSTISIDSEQYCYNLIKSGVFEIEDIQSRILKQDGATSHTSSQTISWLKRRINILNNWPPNSPDLSPIENVWALMDNYLNQNHPTNINEDKDLCTEYWNNVLTYETINKLCEGFKLRINEMLYRNGRNINDFIRCHLKDQINDLAHIPNRPDNLILYSNMVSTKDPSLEDPPNFQPEIRRVLDLPCSPTKNVPWTPEEDEKLKLFVSLYGHKWEIAPLIFGNSRSPSQLRYRNSLMIKNRIKTLTKQ